MLLAALAAPQSSLAQGVQIREDFLWPRLVLNGTAGHIAPVYAMTFGADGKYLVSGGDDKVVQVWEFRDGRPRIDRTIRPPLNRQRGAIRAVAISNPTEGPQFLAVAGAGVVGNGGDILVYRFLGPNDRGTGDLAFVLPGYDPPPAGSGEAPEPNARQLRGHTKPIYDLSFSPDGRYLASCGVDRTIRIWDIQAGDHRPVRVLTGHPGSVLRVAWVDGDRLISAGGIGDGSLRLWAWKDPERPLLGAYSPPARDVASAGGQRVAVNAMALSPDGQFVVTGRESGHLEFFRTGELGAGGIWLNPNDPPNRPVEALAYSPDGQWLAASNLQYSYLDPATVPRTECEITIRRMPAGDQARVVRVAHDVVRALRFSPPDGRFLAAIGGDAQELAVKDLRADLNAPATDLRGPGTVLWDVGFVPDASGNPTVAYARNRPLAQEPTIWEGFDFRAGEVVPIGQPDQLRRAISTYDGWSIRAISDSRLQAERPGVNPVPLTLDGTNGRWMSYTFIPPNPQAGHPQLAVAIGCREGVVIRTLPDGNKTREFLGHSGPVYGVAPSPDGRWLATVSADKTLKLWSLAGCDTVPRLGARLGRDAQGNWVVQEITPRGFAQQMSLKVGDRVTRVRRVHARGVDDVAIDQLDAALDRSPPGAELVFWFDVVHPGGGQDILATTRRDQPALSLLAASNREWVIWMPEGYYDTSIAGDRRLLGWHLNKVVPNPRPEPLPSDFFPMSRYEKLLLRRDVINRLLDTGDPVAALLLVQLNPRPQPPPTIEVFGPQGALNGGVLQVQQPTLPLRIEARGGSGERTVASIRVHNGPVPKPQVNFPLPPPQVQTLPETVQLSAGDTPNSISIEAVNDLGVVGRREVLVQYQPPKPPPAVIRLLIRSVGVESFASADLSRIEFAGRDASELAGFLAKPGQVPRFGPSQVDRVVLDSDARDARAIRAMLDQLTADARQERLGRSDTVFLVIESHVLTFDKDGPLVLGADARRDSPGQTGIRTGEVSECLKYLTERGCFVVLFLDGIHSRLRRQDLNDFRTWVRELVDTSRVVVCVASKQDESDRIEGEGISVFAKAILQSLDTQAGARESHPSIEEFKNVVINRVDELKRNTSLQKADLYAPLNINERLIRIFDPQPRAVENLAGK